MKKKLSILLSVLSIGFLLNTFADDIYLYISNNDSKNWYAIISKAKCMWRMTSSVALPIGTKNKAISGYLNSSALSSCGYEHSYFTLNFYRCMDAYCMTGKKLAEVKLTQTRFDENNFKIGPMNPKSASYYIKGKCKKLNYGYDKEGDPGPEKCYFTINTPTPS